MDLNEYREAREAAINLILGKDRVIKNVEHKLQNALDAVVVCEKRAKDLEHSLEKCRERCRAQGDEIVVLKNQVRQYQRKAGER